MTGKNTYLPTYLPTSSNPRDKHLKVYFLKVYFPKVYFSKVYFCNVYLHLLSFVSLLKWYITLQCWANSKYEKKIVFIFDLIDGRWIWQESHQVKKSLIIEYMNHIMIKRIWIIYDQANMLKLISRDRWPTGPTGRMVNQTTLEDRWWLMTDDRR